MGHMKFNNLKVRPLFCIIIFHRLIVSELNGYSIILRDFRFYSIKVKVKVKMGSELQNLIELTQC